MIRKQQLIFPAMVLLVCLALTYRAPQQVVLWAIVFLLSEALLFLWAVIRNFAQLENWLKRKRFAAIIERYEVYFHERPISTLRSIVGVYLGSAYVGCGDAPSLEKGEATLSRVDPRHLSTRFFNRYVLARGQLALYRDKHAEAIDWLKQSSLYPLGKVHLARLFHYFSLAFVLTNQQLERAGQYAAKASELFPQEVSYRLQHLITRLLARPDGQEAGVVSQLRETIATMPDGLADWERRFFQSYAAKWTSLGN